MKMPETGSTRPGSALQGWITYLTLLGLSLATPGAYSNPSGANVRFGDVRLERSGNQLRVFQGTDRAIIDWNDFSIRGGESTRFRQPRSASAVLNRVRGGDISRIDGSLFANGNVFLLNPNGIVVGKTGVIDTGGFVGSTLDVSDEEFLAGGDLNFRGSSQAGIVNLGTISAAHGDVFLMAATVDNSGFIRAPRGTVGLAAGNDILLKESGEERVFVRGASGSRKENGVVNRGDIEANVAELKSYGGNIYGMAVKNEGRVAATGVSREGGQLFLRAGGGGRIRSTGTLTAKRPANNSGGNIVVDSGAAGRTEVGGTVDAGSSDGSGGSVLLLGNEIEVMNDSLILADGGTGGGRIFIGGGREGLDPRFSNATDVTIGNGALIDASATSAGDGGEVIVFADRDLTFHGFVAARGGANSGDGGFVELSGKRTLTVPSLLGAVGISAANGEGGTLLIDPNDINIFSGVASGSVTGSVEMGNVLYDSDISNFLNMQGSLEIKTNADMGLMGNGDITMNPGAIISWTSNNDLSFEALRDFTMNPTSGIYNTGAGGLSVSAGRSISLQSQAGSEGPVGVTISLEDGDVAFKNTTDHSVTGFSNGIDFQSASISTNDGNIEIIGRGGDGHGVLMNLSDVESFGTGNVTVEGIGSPSAMTSDGIVLSSSFLSTESGTLGVKGIGGPSSSGVSAFGTTLRTTSGEVDVDGTGGTGNSIGIFSDQDSRFEASNMGGVTLTGQGSGGGEAIKFSVMSPLPGGTNLIGGDSTQSVVLASRGGTVDVSYISGLDLLLSNLAPTPADFHIGNSTVDQISSNLLGSLTYESSQNSIAVGDVSANGSISIGAIGYMSLEGAVSAGTMAEFINTDTPGMFFDLQAGSSIDAPLIKFDGGAPGNGSRVTTYRDLDITGHQFVSIDEVQAGSSMLKLTGPAQGANIEITDFGLGPVEFNSPGLEGELAFAGVSPYSIPAALIDGVYYTYFDEISGGDSADSFLIDLQQGNDFYGILSGGGGNDSFQIVEGGGAIAGTLDAGDGFDTLDFSLFNTGIDVTYGNPMFPQIANALDIEKVIGTSATDTLRGSSSGNTFRITSNNAGEINDGQFESFENLVGGGSNDVFTFLNQATVNSIAGGNGSDLLWIDDRNLGGTNTYSISEGQISRNPTYNFGGIEVVQLSLGNGNDTVVTGPLSFTQVLDAGGGNDTLVLPGGVGLGTNPIQFANGQPIVHSNFENPAPPTPGGNNGGSGGNNSGGGNNNPPNQNGPDPGTILSQLVNPTDNGGPQGNGYAQQNNFNSTPGSDNGAGSLQNSLFSSATGAFSAAVAGQATVILLDEESGLAFVPMSLDGTFTMPPIIVISQLQENSGIEVFAELAEAIGYDGPAFLIYSDGPYSIDLGGTPEEAIQNLLSQLLDPEAAGELFAALEMELAIPITSEDGVVSILTVPVEPGAETIATLTEILDDASLAELTAALDG